MEDTKVSYIIEKDKPVLFRDLAKEIPSTTYATFALYRYPAKFIPQVIAYTFKTFGQEGMSAFDPFAGYGTVGPVARLYGIDYELWDLNPLLEHLHSVATMKPVEVDVGALIERMESNKIKFAPDWSNLAYWYPEEIITTLNKAWGFYHSLEEEYSKRILLIPLIKTTRRFSYNDEKRQKLSRSHIATKRVDVLLSKDWRSMFFQTIRESTENIIKKLNEYRELNPKRVDSVIKAGIDTLTGELSAQHDILITSPPYLQAQEYIRSAKMDLFWLGYSEEHIKELGKKELPYRDVPEFDICSETYSKYLNEIEDPHLRRLYVRYFCGVLGSLSRFQKRIKKNMLLFVGPATIRGTAIPIDKIFVEHFTALDWKHKVTLVDTIVARSMFFYKSNPATGIQDKRMSTEHLIVLSRR